MRGRGWKFLNDTLCICRIGWMVGIVLRCTKRKCCWDECGEQLQLSVEHVKQIDSDGSILTIALPT